MSKIFLLDEKILALADIPLTIPLDSNDELEDSDDEFDSEDNSVSSSSKLS